MKRKLFLIIFGTETPAGKAFDVGLLVAITLSLLVTLVESTHRVSEGTPWLILEILEYVFTALFTLEYAVRLWCHPRPWHYVFSFFGIIDLLSILPIPLSFFFPSSRYFLLLRTFRLIRVFRVFHLFTYMNEGYLLLESIRRSMSKILVFFLFVIILIVCIGTLMYILEGHVPGSQFTSIGASIYWAVVTLSTVGYGDVAHVTDAGRFLSALVMLLGYTIVAVPTGIISATVIDTTRKRPTRGLCPRCHHKVRLHDHYCSYCGEKL